METKIGSFTDLAQYFQGGLKQLQLNCGLDYELRKFLDREVKSRYIAQRLALANSFQMQNIRLGDGRSTDENRALLQLDSFDEIEQMLVSYFAQFTQDDRIKELVFDLEVSSLLKSGQVKFQSYYDLTRSMKFEEAAEMLKIISKKKIKLSYGDRSSFGKKLKMLMKIAYNLDLNISNEYPSDFTEHEPFINANNDFLKIKLHKDCFYISFSDQKMHQDFLERSIKKLEKWWIH